MDEVPNLSWEWSARCAFLLSWSVLSITQLAAISPLDNSVSHFLIQEHLFHWLRPPPHLSPRYAFHRWEIHNIISNT